MRLFLIVPTFPKLSETFIVSKFLGLLDMGWDVHIVCGKSERHEWNNYPQLLEFRNRVHVVFPHRPRWLGMIFFPVILIFILFNHPKGLIQYFFKGWRLFGRDIFRKMYLDAHIIAYAPDIIHFEFGSIAVERMYLKELLGCKVTVSFRGYDLNFVGLEDPDFYYEVWENADALHLLGKDLWNRAQKRGCPDEKPHALIPPAVDIDRFSPLRLGTPDELGTDDRPLRILSVGRLEWKKGYEYAIQAVAQLVYGGVSCEYRIVGEGNFISALAFARHQFGIQQVVKIMGACSRFEVIQQMQWADVFLHLAVSEGFCNAVLEAQSMELPVVCSDADGLRENVINNLTGYIIPRRNVSMVVDRLKVIAMETDLRERFGAAGRQRVVENFYLDKQIESFNTFYQNVFHE